MAFKRLQTLDGFLQRRPVGERAAEPAVIHVVHSAAARLFGDGFLRLTFRADKKDRFALAAQLADVAAGVAEHLEGLLQINDVDSVAFAEDILLHLRVPSPRLVAEMHPGLQQLLHRNLYRQSSS